MIFSVLPLTEAQHQMIILASVGLFSLSEILAQIPSIKSNGVFQLIFELLGKLVGKNLRNRETTHDNK